MKTQDINSRLTAFPTPHPVDDIMPNIGLTKREYFAVKAMQGFISAWPTQDGPMDTVTVAKAFIGYADELLKQLEG